jgi:hypothetical protein
MTENNVFLNLLQNTNNRVLEIVKSLGEMKIETNNIKDSQKDIKESIKNIANMNSIIQDSLRNKMTPERCLVFHEQLKKDVFKGIKDGAFGYARTGLTLIKIFAYVSAIFGGTALGANQLINLIGG